MVDLESLQRLTDSKTYPHLVSGVDVDNIRKIVDANPSLFSKSWEENGSKRRDSGWCLLENINKILLMD